MMGRVVVMVVLLMAGFTSAHADQATVVDVFSGDTLKVDRRGDTLTVRLYGIDAPESGQSGDVSSTRFLKRLVLGSPVEMTEMGSDIFGRTLAIIFREGQQTSINAAIVANGYAWVNPDKCSGEVCDRLKTLESQARKLKLGIWSNYDLIPPWEFRDRQRK
jgi:micrococcal nuclease